MDEEETAGTPLPIAPGTPQTLVLGSPLNLCVTTRDLSGMPLRDIRVVALVDGADGPSGTSDATGLCVLRVTPRFVLGARAESPHFDTTRSPNITTTVEGEAFVCLRLRKPYAPTYPFAWQNPILRDRLYRVHSEDRADSGHDVRSALDRATRNQRLLDFIQIYGPEAHVAAPVPPPFVPGRDPVGDEMREVDGRLATFETDATSGDLNSSREDALHTEEEHAYRVGHLAADGTVPTRVSGGASRESARDRRARSADLPAIREARTQLAEALGERADLQFTHRALLEHILRRLFPAIPADVLPLWARYMIVHFSGLRYVNSKFDYHPPDRFLLHAREAELDHAEIGGDAERLRRYLGEARALAAAPENTINDRIRSATRYDSATALLDAAAAAAAPTSSATSSSESERGRSGGGSGTASRRRRTAPAEPQESLRIFHRALAAEWTENLTNSDATALLVFRHENATAPYAITDGADWAFITRSTLLRNNARTLSEWNEPPTGTCTISDRPNSQWMLKWLTSQNRDLTPTVVGAECNQIAELASRARSLPHDTGLTNARDLSFALREARSESGPSLGAIRAQAQRVGGDNHRLWRADSADELELGDIFLQMRWISLTDQRNENSHFAKVSLGSPDFELNVGPRLGGTAPQWVGSNPSGGRPGRWTLDTASAGGENVVLHPADINVNATSADLAAAPEEEARPGATVPLTAEPSTSDRKHYALIGDRLYRRHPNIRNYHEVLIWFHEGVVLGSRGNRIITFETNNPTGINLRNTAEFCTHWGQNSTGGNYPHDTVFGRATGQRERSETASYLVVDHLLGPLDDG